MFLLLSYTAPHFPLHAPDSYMEMYSHISDEKRRAYSAMVSSMDAGIGRVYQALKESDIWDNTILIFASGTQWITLHVAAYLKSRCQKH